MQREDIWRGVLAELELSLSRVNYEGWIKPLVVKEIEKDGEERQVVEIGCPSGFHQQVIEQRYYSQIRKSLERICEKTTELVLVVEAVQSEAAEVISPLFSGQQSSKVKTATTMSKSRRGLNSRLTFEKLVVGSSNNFAHAAAQGVIKNLGRKYNPLFIYGGVGLGKTHLMHAIGHALLNENPELNIIYISAETFANDLVASLQSKQTASFKKKYRSCDVLLIDDIQFISGKEFTQEEFFHTFNELYMSERQIILTSDRSPQEIPKIEERLSSRFMGGLTVDIQPPDFEMRTAILKQKMGEMGEEVSAEAIEIIAEQVESNARELEGTFRRITALAGARQVPLDAELAREFFGVEKERKAKRVRPTSIIAKTAKYFDFKSSDLKGKSRKAPVVAARHMAMYIMKNELGSPYESIGEMLGGRDHTTIMHGVEKIGMAIKRNSQTKKELSEVKQLIFS